MGYGAQNDPWGIAADATMGVTWKLQSVSNDLSPSEAEAQDSNGDVCAATMYDTANQTKSATYVACDTGTLILHDTTDDAPDYRPGTVKSGFVITSIGLETSNSAQVKMTVAGQATSIADSDALIAKYSPADLEIAITRKAIPVGFSVDTGNKLNSSSITLSVDVARELDSQGAECVTDVYGGRIEASGDYVGCSAAAGASGDTGYRVTSGPSISETNTAYETGSIGVKKSLTQMA